MVAALQMLATLMILGFGFALMCQQHGRYLKWMRGLARACLMALVVRPGRWIWHRFRKPILWIAAGAAVFSFGVLLATALTS